MHDVEATIAALGNEPPLDGDGRNVRPDRREISARWLSGTFLTGLTSSVLMGVALFAALDGREQLATPPEVAELAKPDLTRSSGSVAKQARVIPPRAIAGQSDRQRMEVSTMSRQGDREVVRMMPFMRVSMALADSLPGNRRYPAFDPLEVFAEDVSVQTANTGLIYGTKVESEVSLKTGAFPLEAAEFDEKSELSADEVEDAVRTTSLILPDGAVQVASLHYVDEERFGNLLDAQSLGAYGVRIVPENMSIAPRASATAGREFAEEVIPIEAEEAIGYVLSDAGYSGADATSMADALSVANDSATLEEGSVLRLGLEIAGEQVTIVRASLYTQSGHSQTVALEDNGRYAIAHEPEFSPLVASALGEQVPNLARNDLPSVYDGVNRAAASYGLSRSMTRQLVRLLATEVDYQARINPTDRVEVFYSQPDEEDNTTEASELLYVSATFNSATRTFYRYQMQDGTIDYFDQEGRSARQFLLRNPVPNGRFTSGFGGRRHPILGYTKMHTGVDWAAPRGTPIIASGSGTVLKAGWASGYGRQTTIRHGNGYETSYSHQNAIASGVRPGAKIRQGQVIGYVGSTGLSTGPHLHYELSVNGRKVDPMRVRLPESRQLGEDDMALFTAERDRIDTLLSRENQKSLTLASREIAPVN